MAEYHVPVLLEHSVGGLNLKPNGIYADLTFGGGGHSREILKSIIGGKLLAFDQDHEAANQAQQINHKGFTLIEANFRHLKKYLKLHGITQLDGVLADLGVSSHQLDADYRGFSYRFDAPLDLRMDTTTGLSAAQWLAQATETDMHRVFGMYGEVKNAKTLARNLAAAMLSQPILTTAQLYQAATLSAPRGKQNKYMGQVFQALRIEVNQEITALEDMLKQATELLKPNGRLVVISYHSLEDRPVKNYMAKGKFRGEPEKDMYGNLIRPLVPLTRKPIVPTPDEINQNPRARSAKLRIAQKI